MDPIIQPTSIVHLMNWWLRCVETDKNVHVCISEQRRKTSARIIVHVSIIIIIIIIIITFYYKTLFRGTNYGKKDFLPDLFLYFTVEFTYDSWGNWALASTACWKVTYVTHT